MDFSAIKDLYIGSTPVQSAWLNGSKVWGRKPVVDEQAIRDAMVLWYDLKRQGDTNENMAENPVLRDLSGNGHDATCYNFAWSGNSGIGGVAEDFLSSYYMNFLDGRRGRGTLTYNTIHITEVLSNSVSIRFFEAQEPTENIKSYKIKVSGIKQNKSIKYSGSVISGESLPDTIVVIDHDGEYELPEVDITSYNNIGFRTDGWYGTCDITIEQLPLYPHALVSDGVDDYAQVTGLPILTKEKGYTVIAKRDYFSDTVSTCLCSKRKQGVGAGDLSGAFQIERYDSNSQTYRSFSFGSATPIDRVSKDTVYQTSKTYKDEIISIGSSEDSDILNFFRWGDNATANTTIVALYSFILFNRDLTPEEIAWVKTNLIEGNDDYADWYGVEFYTTSPNPDCIRIGNPELHKTLPVHNQMKGVLLADDGTENKMLNESDWTGETLDGSQGQSMVRMPKQSYWRFETDGNIRRVKFSTKPLPGFKPTPQGYVSAYEASVQRSTNKLASVVNTTADYRGGNNNTGWDNTYRSLLGMPATQISRTNFRNYARNRKADSTEWNCMTYDFHKLLYWLFVVEYGTLNSQKAFNADKDANGYAQGGLGNGVTNLSGTKWGKFNIYYPFIPCGYTNSLGNGTGEVEFSMPEEYDSAGLTVKVPRYRGIENPFGHMWQWTDGINVQIEPGNGLSKVFVCDDPSKFNDSNYEGYQHVGNEARTEQYVKEVIFGEGGEIMPKVVGDGASSTKYFCDYHYTNIPTTEALRGVLFGGVADYGAAAGFASAYSRSAPSVTREDFGSRLCFISE